MGHICIRMKKNKDHTIIVHMETNERLEVNKRMEPRKDICRESLKPSTQPVDRLSRDQSRATFDKKGAKTNHPNYSNATKGTQTRETMHHHRPIPGADTRILPPPPPRAALKCPRCDSLDTKFCYFNNYNLSQPRHFCRSCRRYWTRGGALRNVPVGGACRKPSKRPPSSSSSPPRPRKRPAPPPPPPPPPEAGTIPGCTEPHCQGLPPPPSAAVEELRLPPELTGFGFADPEAEWAGAVCFWSDGDPSALFNLP